jgi:hypothetical protein
MPGADGFGERIGPEIKPTALTGEPGQAANGEGRRFGQAPTVATESSLRTIGATRVPRISMARIILL